RLPALADEAAALALGGAPPDPVVLAVGEGVLETSLANRADGADRLRLGRVLLGRRVEDGGVEPSAGALLTPRQVHGLSLPPNPAFQTHPRVHSPTGTLRKSMLFPSAYPLSAVTGCFCTPGTGLGRLLHGEVAGDEVPGPELPHEGL